MMEKVEHTNKLTEGFQGSRLHALQRSHTCCKVLHHAVESKLATLPSETGLKQKDVKTNVCPKQTAITLQPHSSHLLGWNRVIIPPVTHSLLPHSASCSPRYIFYRL